MAKPADGGVVMKLGANVVSLSGGKDSTAMLLMLLERGEPIADIVFFDGGWEFPAMYEHLEKLEGFIGRKITRLRPRLPVGVVTDKTPFDWMFSEYPIAKRGTGEVHKIGRGGPGPMRRWCTGLKQNALKAHLLALTHREGITLPLRQCVGFAADEVHRLDGPTKRDGRFHVQRYPLIEWGVTEADALTYCKERGFTWNRLYDYFKRVSCFCCPLQPLGDLRILRRVYPGLWQRMLDMESWLPEDDLGRRFDRTTISRLEKRFAAEDAKAGKENAREYDTLLCVDEMPFIMRELPLGQRPFHQTQLQGGW
jgi:3'-phosphoadenosine 5'-phosphosulfate sulfotransferase (PAPS reductase)/FAD synthetase